MRVDCEGCAGCCLDWRPLADGDIDHERRGPHRPLDDTYNLVPLERDEVRNLVDAGLGDALAPRLWEATDGPSVRVDGYDLAAVAGRPAFFVGLRKVPKPVAPFGREPAWLDTCVFLDPATLQCRIHGTDRYPAECADYPGHNLALDVETECERVERETGDDRLLDGDPPAGMGGLLLGPGALGGKVFVHPDPDRLDGVVDRVARGEATPEDRAAFVGVAVGSSPGTTAVNEARAEQAREAALDADSWVGRAAAEWAERTGEEPADPASAANVEGDRGAPETPGWE